MNPALLMRKSGMNVRAVRTSVFRENADLVTFVRKHVLKLKDGSILAITSKIVALSEGRVANARDKEKHIKRESAWALQTHKKWWWTQIDGQLLVNAGIDDSNADGKIVLLPKDSFKSAEEIRKALKKYYKVKKLGIIITDSRISPMRAGVTGLAVGYAGFCGVRNYRGKRDIFGRKLKVTMTDVADSLATAATLVMGEGAERQPLAIIEDASVEFANKVNRREVQISAKDDMYTPLFKSVGKSTRSRRG